MSVSTFENVYKINYTGEPLYNVLMEEHDKMIVNNLICETLHPKSLIAELYSINFKDYYENQIVKNLA